MSTDCAGSGGTCSCDGWTVQHDSLYELDAGASLIQPLGAFVHVAISLSPSAAEHATRRCDQRAVEVDPVRFGSVNACDYFVGRIDDNLF